VSSDGGGKPGVEVRLLPIQQLELVDQVQCHDLLAGGGASGGS